MSANLWKVVMKYWNDFSVFADRTPEHAEAVQFKEVWWHCMVQHLPNLLA
jgi:hypothetical protein